MCFTVDVSCNFESGFCGWTGEVDQMMYKFGTIQSNVIWALSSAEQTISDHSSKNGSEYFSQHSFLIVLLL